MDCVNCESYTFNPGRIWGDPDRCYPGKAECKENAPDSGPCRRMLGAIYDTIHDGYLETEHGQFRTRECLQDEQQEEDIPDHFRDFDFSSAPYFWIPNNYDVKMIEPYQNEKEIFNAYFI
jgi:hypothetical protein